MKMKNKSPTEVKTHYLVGQGRHEHILLSHWKNHTVYTKTKNNLMTVKAWPMKWIRFATASFSHDFPLAITEKLSSEKLSAAWKRKQRWHTGTQGYGEGRPRIVPNRSVLCQEHTYWRMTERSTNMYNIFTPEGVLTSTHICIFHLLGKDVFSYAVSL